MKGAVLFLTLPYQSHQIPCFEFARNFQDKGYHIFFTGTESQRDLIESEGFFLEKFKFLAEYEIQNFSIYIGLLIKSLVDRNFLKQRYREFYSVFLELNHLVREKKVNKIYIDSAIREYAYFVLPNCSEVSIITTGLSPRKAFGIPPQNSDYIPNQSLLSNLYCEFLWFKKRMNNYLKWGIFQTCFVFKSDDFFLKRLKSRYQLRGDITRNLSDIILAPESLEFSFRKTYENEVYFHEKAQRVEKVDSPEYEELISKVEAMRRENKYVVYCSLGTLNWIYRKDVELFYKKLIKAIKILDDSFLVISTGTSQNINISKEQVLFTSFLPQQNFLKYTDVMINHAGMGGIKDCLDSGIPFICCPLNYKVDQPGNAARVVYHKFGRRLNLRRSTTKEICWALSEALKSKK